MQTLLKGAVATKGSELHYVCAIGWLYDSRNYFLDTGTRYPGMKKIKSTRKDTYFTSRTLLAISTTLPLKNMTLQQRGPQCREKYVLTVFLNQIKLILQTVHDKVATRCNFADVECI